MQLNETDIKNLLAIISRPGTTIQANEAKTVGDLQAKLFSMIPKEEVKEETN